MEHGHDSMSSCTMSMVWNWQTVDACFLSEAWHVRSKVGFAFSVIGVFLIVCGIEATRRTARDFDRWVSTQRRIQLNNNSAINHWTLRPTWKEQTIRGAFYGVQFSAAYIVMLIAMSFNGFIIFAIFLGGFVGYTLFGGDTLDLGQSFINEGGGQGGACC